MQTASVPEGLLLCQMDRHGHIVDINDAWHWHLNLSLEQLKGRLLMDLDPSGRLQKLPTPDGPFCLLPMSLQDGFGQVRRIQWLVEADESGHNWVATGWDITALHLYHEELENALQQTQQLVVTDPLTNLKNRRAFDERLQEELARHRRFNSSLSMLMVDVDHFKDFNDAFGHQAGDDVLQRLGQCLQANIRLIDFVARIGGEEFVVLLPNTTIKDSLRLGERLRQAVEQSKWQHRDITITHEACLLESAGQLLYQKADQALYRAKEGGRNRIEHAGMIDP